MQLLRERLPAIVQEMIDRPYPELKKELLAAGGRFRSVGRRERYECILRNYSGLVLREVEDFALANRSSDWLQSGTAKWLAEEDRRSKALSLALEEERRLERIMVAERRAERARARAVRHAQRMTDRQIMAAPAVRAAKQLSRCSIRAGLEQIVQGVSITVLGHVPEEAMRCFTRGLARLSDRDLESLRRKVPKQRKSQVAILSKAIDRELASRKST